MRARVEEWIRAEVLRELGPSVRSGVGSWARRQVGDAPIALGEPIYLYGDQRGSVALHSEGIEWTLPVKGSCRFTDVVEVVPTNLPELVRIRQPGQLVSLWLRVRGGEHEISVPIEVYSGLLPALVHIIEHLATIREEPSQDS